MIQLTLTLKMTAAQVVKMSVTVSNNRVWDCNNYYPYHHASPTYKVTIIAMQSNNWFYYINTNEIPGELSRENLISSHVKITCYLHV